jgi:hypothetical protein
MLLMAPVLAVQPARSKARLCQPENTILQKLVGNMTNPSKSKMLQGASSRYGGSPKTLCRGQLVNNKMVTTHEALTNYALNPSCKANVRHDQQLEPSNTRSFCIV